MLEFVINTELLRELVSEKGFDQFTEEEKAGFVKEGNEYWESALQEYVASNLTEDTEEARTALHTLADQYYRMQGYSPEYLADSIAKQEAQDRYLNSLVGPESVTKEQVQEYLETIAASQEAQIGGSAYMYELYQAYMGMDFKFTPAGYRRVLHILLTTDADLMTAYNTARQNWEELSEQLADQSEENETEADEGETPVTQEMVDEAYQAMQDALAAVIASKQTVIDEIEARLASGEAFEQVAPNYNEDAGEDFTEGYKVHPESIMYDPVFRDAAFSEEMAKPGNHSKPVVGSYGIHILYYLDDVPAGAVPMTDELYKELSEDLLTELQYEAADKEITEKAKASLIVRETAVIEALDNAADDVVIDFDEDLTLEEDTEAEPETAE